MGTGQQTGGGWISTGLQWRDGRPLLSAVHGRRVHERVAEPGTVVGWLLGGPRRCTGAWLAGATERTPCPHHAEIEPDGGAVQCPACQSVDRGLALARDQILDDGRTYRLYLAWFGDGLVKVGLTAEQRGTSRLLEQGALAWTFAARGALPAVRRAELTIAASGLARERFNARTKPDHWWSPGDAAHRRTLLLDARTAAHRLLAGHAVELLADHPVTDHVVLFGLAEGAPAAYGRIETLAPGAVVAGALRPPIGRHLLLDQPDGAEPLLLDTRLLTGWTLTQAAGRPASGLVVRPRVRPEVPDTQEALF
ncbi:DUF2797 domain-containing protein [Kitasatospora sp. A2-31]|uniref:DUF2797 domain-containing protein n=1 Tax=Kitasatospora sp. A2-31 TaxID=2916414 RepID=UPI001EE94639|nr:DUF2797 domain-containing protein [Kitasatospora sp. A2-31]MCG6493775.1 DUF2797 domain-containing protein [Kitasatospora sp. A2-31]